MGTCINGRKKDENTIEKKPHQEVTIITEEKISFKSLLFEVIEKYIGIKYFNLYDYFLVYHDFFHKANLKYSKSENLIFFRDKISGNPILIDSKLNSECKGKVFDNFNECLFDSFVQVNKSIYKKIYKISYEDDENLPFFIYLLFGVTYCKASYITKIETLFNVLSSNTTAKIYNDNLTKLFFSFLLLTPSTVILNAYNLAMQNFEFNKPSKVFDFDTVYTKYEIKDSENCVNLIISILFKDSNEIGYDEFVMLFKTNDDLKCLLYPNGCRWLIESNNLDTSTA